MGRKPIPASESVTRKAILRAAAEVLPRQGLANTAVEEILERAGVSRRTFYRTFSNLEHVLAGLYEIAVQVVLRDLTQGLQTGDDPRRRAQGLVDAYLAMSERDGPLMRLLEAEALRPASLLWAQRARLLEQLSGEIARALGLPATVDPLLVVGALVALEGITMVSSANGVLEPSERARVRAAATRLFEALLDGERTTDTRR